MDLARFIGQPGRDHTTHPINGQSFVAPRSCLNFRPGRDCSHGVVGEVQDIPVLGWLCTIIFSIFFISFKFQGTYLQPAIFPSPSPFMRWPGTYRPLRVDSGGTCNCSTVAGEVTCTVIATRWRWAHGCTSDHWDILALQWGWELLKVSTTVYSCRKRVCLVICMIQLYTR